jgi:hypothetical protein
MTLHISDEEREKMRDELYARYKAEGLSDRDAYIMASAGINPRCHAAMAGKFRISMKKVNEIISSYEPLS